MKSLQNQSTYIIAVSGGVDSVVLLDILTKITKDKLVVAHFDHGIRDDSSLDWLFVEQLANKYKLEFEYAEGKLGKTSSEEKARNARYDFLFNVQDKYAAKAIYTAHHQDDVIETAVINLNRGTNRRGISSLRSTSNILRPLLNIDKAEIIEYAINNNLAWREDSTNVDQKYTRNYIRAQLSKKLSKEDKDKLLNIIDKQTDLNNKIDQDLETLLKSNLKNKQIPRLWLSTLSSSLITEVIAYWLRKNGIYNYNQKTLKRLNTELRVAKVNSLVDVRNDWKIIVRKEYLALEPIER